MTVKYVAMYELESDSDYLICESLEEALAAANRWAPVVAAVGSEDPFRAVMVFVHDLPADVWAVMPAKFGDQPRPVFVSDECEGMSCDCCLQLIDC